MPLSSPFISKIFINDKCTRAYFHSKSKRKVSSIIIYNETKEFCESNELELNATQQKSHFWGHGSFSYYLLQCISIPLFLLCLWPLVVARQLGVFQESYHLALWGCGQAVEKVSIEKSTLNKNVMRGHSSLKTNMLTRRLVLMASCTLVSFTVTETSHNSKILF